MIFAAMLNKTLVGVAVVIYLIAAGCAMSVTPAASPTPSPDTPDVSGSPAAGLAARRGRSVPLSAVAGCRFNAWTGSIVMKSALMK